MQRIRVIIAAVLVVVSLTACSGGAKETAGEIVSKCQEVNGRLTVELVAGAVYNSVSFKCEFGSVGGV